MKNKYLIEIEIYFSEDEKAVNKSYYGDSIEDVKAKVSHQLVDETGNVYSMLSGEVVLSYTITLNGEYVDSEELFMEYKSTHKGGK